MTVWLKTFAPGMTGSPRNDPTQASPVGSKDLFLEPEGRTSTGIIRLRADGLPWGEPRYAVGDLICDYWSGSRQITEAWEVVGLPNPSSSTGWAWETPVVLRVRTDHGVPLQTVGIETRSLARQIRLRLTAAQEAAVRKEFDLPL